MRQMNLFIVLALALALAMDAFAVSLGISITRDKITGKQTFRLAFHFGLFQFLMPIVGWITGETILKFVQSFDHWIALVLLLFIGGKMIYESFKLGEKHKRDDRDPTKGSSLLFLSIATSIDALAVGLSLAVLEVNIIYPAAIIGIVAFLMTGLGMKIGPHLGKLMGKGAELLGGVILILVGLKILFEHL